MNVLVVKGFFCNFVRHQSFFISTLSEGDYFLKTWEHCDLNICCIINGCDLGSLC